MKKTKVTMSPHEGFSAGREAPMNVETKRKQSFLLRLPLSIREQASEIAHADGTSLNHFISLAVAEKLSRMGRDPGPQAAGPRPMFPERLQDRPRFQPGSFLRRPALQ